MRCHVRLAILALSLTFVAAQWPVFRGNPAQTAATIEALPEQLTILWTFKTGNALEGAVAIVDGIVYVGALDGYTYALNLADGKEKWKVKTGGIKAPVSVHEDRVYVGNEDGVFYALDAVNGKEIWKFDAQSEVTSGATFVGLSVLFGCGDEQLHCLNRVDGQPRWKFQVQGGPVQGTPVIAGDKTYAAGCDSTLHSIELKTGKELGSVELGGQVGASAATGDGKLFIATMTNEVLAIDLATLKIDWRFESRKKQPFFASPALTSKLAIVGCRDKRLYGLDRGTGKEVWSYLTDGRIDSSPVVAGPRVYVGSFDKNLYGLDASTGNLVQKVPLDASILASPAVAGGRLVIGTEKGTLYCLGAPPR